MNDLTTFTTNLAWCVLWSCLARIKMCWMPDRTGRRWNLKNHLISLSASVVPVKLLGTPPGHWPGPRNRGDGPPVEEYESQYEVDGEKYGTQWKLTKVTKCVSEETALNVSTGCVYSHHTYVMFTCREHTHEHWSERIVRTALGHCRQNIVPNINPEFSGLFQRHYFSLLCLIGRPSA